MALTSRRAVASPLQVTALPPLEGVTAPVSIPAGDYEPLGGVTVMSTVASLLVKSKL